MTSGSCHFLWPFHTMIAGSSLLNKSFEHGAHNPAPVQPDGIKWHEMALFIKIRIWDVPTSYKKATKTWRDVCKSLQKPGFSWSKSAIFSEKPRPLPTVRRSELSGTKWQQMALFIKIRTWDVATSYKKATKKWRNSCKSLQKPGFSWSKSAIFRKIPCPPSSSPQRGSRALTMRQHG